ncbi:MAG: sugar ABC transporter permease [Clostridia bacterium]|nr:sugar ABC transporter permease [Clostridia bacterium]
MKYIDYITLPPLKRFGIRLGTGLRRLPRRLGRGVAAVWNGMRAGAAAAVRTAKTYSAMFREGDKRTRLSYLVMGSGCFLRGQIVKGLLYLFLQAAFIVYMVTFGIRQLALLPTLGKAVKKEVWNPDLQIYEYVQGDNSMLILLFGILTICIVFAFLRTYYSSILTAFRNQRSREAGQRLPGIITDVRNLFDKRLHVAFLTPPVAGVFLFTILPLIFMILIAFTNYNSAHQPPGTLFTWIGFENFKNIFWSNPVQSQTFAGVFRWTLVWAFFATFSNYFLGMILALMINKKGIRFKKLWRTIFIVTIAVPQFVSLLLMSRLLADQGALNVLLGYLGIEPVPFLTNALWARITVIVVNIWVGIPYTMLITSGILMNIPTELYESARIDGAGAMQTFTKITFPYMLFVTTPYLITQFIGNINNFNVIYLLSGGGPLSLDYYQAGKTDLLVTWLYKLTVNNQDYNLASAIGIIIFVISAVLSLVVYNMSSSARKEDTFQ